MQLQEESANTNYTFSPEKQDKLVICKFLIQFQRHLAIFAVYGPVYMRPGRSPTGIKTEIVSMFK
jgi:hypothetical protein